MRSLFFAAVAALSAAGATAQDITPTLTITGSATISAPPDVAKLTAGVETVADTAGGAMSQNAAAMTGVFAALESAQIDQSDFQTSQLRLDQVWDDGRRSEDGARSVIGFRATNLVTITVRDVAALGGLIDGLSAAGANNFHNISFAIDDPAPLVDAARAAAVEDARRKAELYASAAGVSLGPVLTIREPGTAPGPGPFAARAEMASDTPIAAGSVELGVRVEIVYALE